MKNLKKKLSHSIYIVLFAFIVTSCSNRVSEKEAVGSNFKHKIYDVKGGWQYTTVEFEDHKYLCNSSGGIIHVESCQCKRQKN